MKLPVRGGDVNIVNFPAFVGLLIVLFGVKPIIKLIFDVCVADVNDPSKLLSNLFFGS
jgi:hypothetical protein